VNDFKSHPTALELAEAVIADQPAGLALHLAGCVECRVRFARLTRARAVNQAPSDGALSRIVDSAAHLRPAVTAAVQGGNKSPRPGEIWRVGKDEAILVWVRKVLDGAVDVMPVTLDVNLADDQTLVVPLEETALGVELALLTALRAHIHPKAFLSWVTELPVTTTAQVTEVLSAAREGRPAEGVSVGMPVYDPNDQIVEYQQTLADLLADAGPGAWTAAEAPSESHHAELLQLLERDLVERHPCRIHRSLPVVAALPSAAIMTAAARVSFADTIVVVAVLANWQSEPEDGLARACQTIMVQEPGSHAVAVCSPQGDRLAVVVTGADTYDAFESPSGHPASPRVAGTPMPVVDALAKYLDASAPAWTAADDGALRVTPDLPEIARHAARASVVNLAEQGRRARTPAKTQAWTALTDATAGNLAQAVARIIAGDSASDVLNDLTTGGENP